MPVFETNSGHRLQIQLPRHAPWDELKEAREEYERLMQERRVTNRRLGALMRERDSAINRDRMALAQAIKEGKAEPGDKNVQQVEKEVAACRRRIEAIEIALDDAEQALIDVVDEYRDDWIEETEPTLDEAYAAYADAIEVVVQARAKVSQRWAMLAWLRGFPEQVVSFSVGDPYVGTLTSPNGDPFHFGQVADALRADATRPEPKQPKASIPNQWPALGVPPGAGGVGTGVKA